MITGRRVAVVLMGMTFVATGAACQWSAGQVALSAGSATDQRGVRSDAITLAPTFVFNLGSPATLVLGASSTRFQNGAWQLGGGTSLSARAPVVAGFALAFAGGANIAHASFDATFAQADAVPALEWSGGPITLIGGAHVAAGYARIAASVLPSGASSAGTLSTQSRGATAPSYGAEVHLGTRASPFAVVSYREEPTHVGGALVSDRTVGATLTLAGVAVAATAGQRRAADERVAFGSGSVALPLSRGISFTLTGGSYPSNRLTGATGGRFLSSGFSWQFGGGSPTVPQPSGVLAPSPGATRLAIRARSARQVEVAGDWNAWTPTPATRAANGVWYVDVPLKPGEYRYAFFVDGTEWRVPEGVVGVDDGYGGRSAYVTVVPARVAPVTHTQEER